MNLYRTRLLTATLLLALTIAGLLTATAQRKKAHKLRATALLELTTDSAGNTAARLTPIVILDEGRFRDASIYKATPRPMAAADGIVYEAQKSGVPVGYVTIGSAAHAGGIWTATGKWQPSSTVAKKETPAPTPLPRPGDDRPILHRGGTGSANVPGTPEPAPSSQPAPQSTPEATPTSQTTSEPAPDSSDRPVLRRRTSSSTPEAEASPTPKSEIAPAPANAPAPAAPHTPALKLNPGTAMALAAVSDSQATDDPHSFAYQWQPGEQEKMEAKLRKFALQQLPPENAKLGDNAFTNVVIRSFDVDATNEAVLVLTAEIPGSYMTPGSKAAPGKFVSRYITLIARTDYEGNFQRLAVSVTDSSRLDVAPRLELIDAVDVDGDGYAELLFREYSFDDKGFVVYGIGRSTVTKVFEGASQALK
jgi:hypothetical protein